MKKIAIAVMLLMTMPVAAQAAREKLPGYITKPLRQACEKDVRYYCGKGSVKNLKSCVKANFKSLNQKCQDAIFDSLPAIREWERTHGE
jgi:hypothetical protein